MASESLSALAAVFGAYFRQNKDVILALVCKDPVIQNLFNVMEGVKDEVPLPSVTIGNNLAKPGGAAFSASNNAIVWGGRMGKVRDIQVDLTLNPRQYEKQWLAFNMKPGSKQEKIPYQEFVMMKLVIAIRRAIYRNAIYRGIYNASGSTTAACFNGYDKIILDEVTAGNITEVATGAITSTNVDTKLLMVYDNLDDDTKDEDTVMDVNSQIFDWYVRKLNPVYNANLTLGDAGVRNEARINEIRLVGTNCTVRRIGGKATSQRVSCTLKENMYLFVDTLGEEANIDVEKEKRELHVMMDFKMGVNFGQIDSSILSVNDQL